MSESNFPESDLQEHLFALYGHNSQMTNAEIIANICCGPSLDKFVDLDQVMIEYKPEPAIVLKLSENIVLDNFLKTPHKTLKKSAINLPVFA